MMSHTEILQLLFTSQDHFHFQRLEIVVAYDPFAQTCCHSYLTFQMTSTAHVTLRI